MRKPDLLKLRRLLRKGEKGEGRNRGNGNDRKKRIGGEMLVRRRKEGEEDRRRKGEYSQTFSVVCSPESHHRSGRK
jgi:hypothetical protein